MTSCSRSPPLPPRRLRRCLLTPTFRLCAPLDRAVRILPEGGARRPEPHCQVAQGATVDWKEAEVISRPVTQKANTSSRPLNLSLPPQPGYARLCCLGCIQTRDTNHGTTCICRVPSDKLKEVGFAFGRAQRGLCSSFHHVQCLGRCAHSPARLVLSFFLATAQGTIVECQTCGCRGCGG